MVTDILKGGNNMQKVLSSFIRKRNEKYHVYVEYLNEEGKKKQRSEGSCKTKKEAEKLLIEVKNNINKDKYIIPKDITFVQRCYQYYDDKSIEFSPVTLKNQKNKIKKHIEPYWGNTKLCDVTISNYQRFINEICSDEKLSTGTKQTILRTSTAVLREAYRCQEIQTKITDFIRVPKLDDSDEVDIYSVDEVKYILKKAKEKSSSFEIILNLFVYGGLRKGEAVGLTWDYVDFENNTITIKNNLQYVDAKYIMRTPKTKSGIRTIHLPDVVMDLLRAEKIRQNKLRLQGLMKEKEYDTVCINKDNYYYSPIIFAKNYKRFIKKIGLEYKKPHSLRHAHVSMLVASGMDIKTISARVGHSNTQITLSVYSHVFKENDKIAADKITDILSQ